MLSKAAHERAASERDKLTRLQDKLGTLMTLSEDDRAQLDALAATTTQALSEAQATMERAGHDLAWHERQAVLVAAVESATSALEEQNNAWRLQCRRRRRSRLFQLRSRFERPEMQQQMQQPCRTRPKRLSERLAASWNKPGSILRRPSKRSQGGL